MKKLKEYRIIEEYYVYSKKKGAYSKRKLVAKYLKTLEEAHKWITINYKEALLSKNNNLVYITKGMLYPGSLTIK